MEDPPFKIQLIGHVSYVLLVSAALVRAILPLRLLAIAAGGTSVWYGLAIASKVDVFWESIFTLVNVVQAIILVREQYGVRLTEEELTLRAGVFPHMSKLDFHRFIRAGSWQAYDPGTSLTVRGEPVERIVLLSDGTADVVVDGTTVGRCRRGDFIGEIAFVTGNPATATVTTATPTRLLAWRFADLRTLIDKHPELRTAMQTVLSQNLITKLNEQRDRQTTIPAPTTSPAPTTPA